MDTYIVTKLPDRTVLTQVFPGLLTHSGSTNFNLLKLFFFHGRIPPAVNHTLITLIPEVDMPEHPRYFRPISLCNTI